MPRSDTATNRRRLLAYIAEVRTALRMDNWDVVLHDEPCEDDCHAETWQHENHTILNIRISKDFFDLAPEGIRNTVIHELTHAQHRDVSRLWDAVRVNAGGVQASAAWDTEFVVHMERFVSWTTDRIENSIPLWDRTATVGRELPTGCYLHDHIH